jgi:hypothetical protein
MSICPHSGSFGVQDIDDDSDDGVVDDDNNDYDDGRVQPGRARSVTLGLSLGLDGAVNEDENVRKFSSLLGFKRHAPEPVLPAKRRQIFRLPHNSHTAGSNVDDEDEYTVIHQGSGSGSASVSGEDISRNNWQLRTVSLLTLTWLPRALQTFCSRRREGGEGGHLGPTFNKLLDKENNGGDDDANDIVLPR